MISIYIDLSFNYKCLAFIWIYHLIINDKNLKNKLKRCLLYFLKIDFLRRKFQIICHMKIKSSFFIKYIGKIIYENAFYESTFKISVCVFIFTKRGCFSKAVLL